MDLPLVSASPSLEAKPPCRVGGRSGKHTGPGSSDSSSSPDKAFSDALRGPCEPGDAAVSKQAPPVGKRDGVPGDKPPGSHPKDAAIAADPAEGACLLGIRSFSRGGWTIRQTNAADPAAQDGVHGQKAAQGCLALKEPHPEIDDPQSATGALGAKRNRAAGKASSLDAVQEGDEEGTVLPEDKGRGKAQASETNPRIVPSRPEILKGSGEPGELPLGDARSAGQPAQGEAAAAAGREGASLKQEARIDPPAGAPSAHASSLRQVPVHPVHPASAGTFRLFRNAVHLRIHDEELGPMRWKIHLNGTGIRAEAVVETSRIQALLHDNQSVLESRLNALGVEVEDLDVSVDQGSQNFCPFSEQHGFATAPRLTQEAFFGTGTEPHILQLFTNPDQGLDLYA